MTEMPLQVGREFGMRSRESFGSGTERAVEVDSIQRRLLLGVTLNSTNPVMIGILHCFLDVTDGQCGDGLYIHVQRVGSPHA